MVRPNPPQHNPLPQIILTIGLAVLTSAGSVFVAVQQTDSGKYQSLVENQAKTIETLSARVKELEIKIFDLTAQLTQQHLELEQKYDNHAELKNIIDSAPLVAWFNRVSVDSNGVVTFPMWHINALYTYTHGVTLERYRGQTADKIWPPKVAEQFNANNLKVLNAKDGSCTTETYPRRTFNPESLQNPLTENRVCKWLVPFEGGYGILGMAVAK